MEARFLLPIAGPGMLFSLNALAFLFGAAMIARCYRERRRLQPHLENYLEAFAATARYVRYTPAIQVIKVWPKADYPLIEVGVMELNRYPENYFAEVEQAAFSPANVVPGVGFSPDKMLQGRLFSYGDTPAIPPRC